MDIGQPSLLVKNTRMLKIGLLILFYNENVMSKLPLPKEIGKMEESKFKNAKSLGETRDSKYLLSDFEAFMHLMKGTIGTGILSTPMAYKNLGIWAGLVITLLLGALVYYGLHMLVKCNHVLCWRIERRQMTFEQLVEESFKNGPKKCQRMSTFSRYLVLIVLGSFMFGVCCIYVIFISINLKKVVKEVWVDLDERLYMAMLLVPVILLNLLKNLKYMAPLSIIGTIMMLSVLSICTYYLIINYHSPLSRTAITNPLSWSTYFGVILFGLRGATAIPVENAMQHPEHLISPPFLILIQMAVISTVTALFSFFAYAAYGDEIKATVSLNLPDDVLSKIAKVLLCCAMFLSISIYFYVPYKMVHTSLEHKFEKHPVLYDSLMRIGLTILLVGIAVVIPTLEVFISLVGSVSQATLGFVFPAILETLIYWEKPGMGFAHWRLLKNILMVLFGIYQAVFGTSLALRDIANMYSNSLAA